MNDSTHSAKHHRRFRFQTVLACLLACVGMVGLAVEGPAQDLAGDRQALIALYNATDGANWANNQNWLSDEPLGDWYGVTVSDGRVTELNLRGNQLTGSIPAELGNLSSLTWLNLGGNQLTGSIPPELGDLVKLTWVDLWDNQLTGSIPVELGKLSSLSELYLGGSQLTGSIPTELGNLTNLTVLGLDGTQLTGPIPPELGNLARLTRLDLPNNQLTGTIPTELGNLSSLTYLSLANNQLTGPIPPELGNLARLTRLDLSDNQLTVPIPSELGNLSSLRSLGLANNQLTGPLPQSFTHLMLEYFYFNGNPGLSVPDDAALREWLVGITDVRDQDYSPASPFVPIILSAAGRNNSFFTSEMTVTNRGTVPASLAYTYTAHIGGRSGVAYDSLAPGHQRIVPNAIDYLKTRGVPIPDTGNRIGTLRVELSGFSSSEVGITVRTTTTVPEGRAGLAYPGVSAESGFDEAVYLCGLRQNEQDRSNLAFQNMGTAEAGSITLRTTSFPGTRPCLEVRFLEDVTLAPGGFHQYSGVLEMCRFHQRLRQGGAGEWHGAILCLRRHQRPGQLGWFLHLSGDGQFADGGHGTDLAGDY